MKLPPVESSQKDGKPLFNPFDGPENSGGVYNPFTEGPQMTTESNFQPASDLFEFSEIDPKEAPL